MINKTSKCTCSLICLLLVLLLCFSLFACSTEADSSATQSTKINNLIKIAVLQSDNSIEYENAYRGFMSELSKNEYEVGEDISVSLSVLTDDENYSLEAAKSCVADNPDLIYAIGETAAKSASSATDTVPIIFSHVSDPIGLGLMKSCEKPDGNVTGVSDFTPVEQQLSFIKELYPEARTLSYIYCANDENSLVVYSLLKSQAEKLSLKVKAYPITNEKELNSDIDEALESDVLYLPEDTVTLAFSNSIIKAATKVQKPVFSSGDTLLKSGALATCLPDSVDMGHEAGELALIALKDLKQIGDIAVEYPDNCTPIVNESQAKKLKLDISGLEDDIELYAD